MSTVAFELGAATWNPEHVREVLANEDRSTITMNLDDKVALFVQRNDTPIRWGDTRELINTTWELYVIYWCEETTSCSLTAPTTPRCMRRSRPRSRVMTSRSCMGT